MQTFLALYRGDTISSARIVATTVNPIVVGMVAEMMLDSGELEQEADPVREAVNQGRKTALRLITEEMNDV